MARLNWADVSKRKYSSGVDNAVIFLKESPAIPWNGLISIEEAANSESVDLFLDGAKASFITKILPFSATVKAYTYPDAIDGLIFDNKRSTYLNLCYRTFENEDPIIHLLYNVMLSPSDASRGQIDSVTEFSWTIITRPATSYRGSSTAHVIVKPSELRHDVADLFYNQIYGTDDTDAYLPPLKDLTEMLEEPVMLRIIDHGDGTWTAIGPDSAIQMLDDTTFEIDWPSAIFISDDTYELFDL